VNEPTPRPSPGEVSSHERPTAGGRDHLELVARTLQIAPEVWTEAVSELSRSVPPPPPGESADDELARCLPVLARAFQARSPHVAPLPPGMGSAPCPACAAAVVEPALCRRAAGEDGSRLVFGRCSACGHGALLEPRPAGALAAASVHDRAAYFQRRTADGVGYDGYAAEAAYRERKGAALVARLRDIAGPITTLLEVGSGFGFTRIAAERGGIRTTGVDVSAAACRECHARNGLLTTLGTLAEGMAGPEPAVRAGAFDAVLYQFVLEHVVDLLPELVLARAALRSGGWLFLLVPSFEAIELEVFGASYRSLRADHLHLMTRRSLAALAARAGFGPPQVDSHCNLHLLRDCLSQAALQRIYDTGRGPDLFVAMQNQQ
jgi:SAM-dependent methyltransferase